MLKHDEIVSISGMTFTNIHKGIDEWGIYHVNREDIEFHKPDADISTVNKFARAALDYIDDTTDFISTDEAKIDVYYS